RVGDAEVHRPDEMAVGDRLLDRALPVPREGVNRDLVLQPVEGPSVDPGARAHEVHQPEAVGQVDVDDNEPGADPDEPQRRRVGGADPEVAPGPEPGRRPPPPGRGRLGAVVALVLHGWPSSWLGVVASPAWTAR